MGSDKTSQFRKFQTERQNSAEAREVRVETKNGMPEGVLAESLAGRATVEGQKHSDHRGLQ